MTHYYNDYSNISEFEFLFKIMYQCKHNDSL